MARTRRSCDHLVNQDTKPVKKARRKREIDHVGHAHQAISLFLDGRKKIKIPKAKFQSTETSFGDF